MLLINMVSLNLVIERIVHAAVEEAECRHIAHEALPTIPTLGMYCIDSPLGCTADEG